jgi:hypothetical protein
VTTKTTKWTTLAATAALFALTVHGTHGQTRINPLPATALPQGNLALDEVGTQPKGYAFLIQTMPEGRAPYVHVQLGPESNLGPPEDWTWEVKNTDNELKSAVTMKWYAQAACPDALTYLSVSGPGGTLVQNPLKNPIWGYFSTQSFTIETVQEICEDWANANKCDPAEPGCQLYEDFNITGGVAPASNADRLRLKASCATGPLPDAFYGPKLRIRCDRGPY